MRRVHMAFKSINLRLILKKVIYSDEMNPLPAKVVAPLFILMVCVISNYICDKTKKNVVFGNRPDENFFITHAPTHSPARMCIRI